MKQVTILAIDNILATTLVGPMDFFSLATGFSDYHCGANHSTYFSVEIASIDGKLVNCYNGFPVQPHKAIDEIASTDLIILPCIAGFLDDTLRDLQEIHPWLQQQAANGVLIMGICNGAFAMADAGLLDGKVATTHWSFHEKFSNRYPEVRLDTHRLVTKDGNLYCAGGTTAWVELCLYIIQEFYGRALAIEFSKALVLKMSNTEQTPFTPLLKQTNHNDNEIQTIQNWLRSHSGDSISIDGLSDQFNMSARNLNRRFKEATGLPPIRYLQILRIEEAKLLLEKNQFNVDEVAFQVGYEDTNFLRTVFKRHTGLSPKAYQNLFGG